MQYIKLYNSYKLLITYIFFIYSILEILFNFNFNYTLDLGNINSDFMYYLIFLYIIYIYLNIYIWIRYFENIIFKIKKYKLIKKEFRSDFIFFFNNFLIVNIYFIIFFNHIDIVNRLYHLGFIIILLIYYYYMIKFFYPNYKFNIIKLILLIIIVIIFIQFYDIFIILIKNIYHTNIKNHFILFHNTSNSIILSPPHKEYYSHFFYYNLELDTKNKFNFIITRTQYNNIEKSMIFYLKEYNINDLTFRNTSYKILLKRPLPANTIWDNAVICGEFIKQYSLLNKNDYYKLYRYSLIDDLYTRSNYIYLNEIRDISHMTIEDLLMIIHSYNKHLNILTIPNYKSNINYILN